MCAAKRALDINERALRKVIVGLGGPGQGVPREAGFEITVASEVMAIIGLASDLGDLQERLGRIRTGYNQAGQPVFARELGAEGAMTVLLKQAFYPNLVQTMEHQPAFVHMGPFGHIAHGTNSVVATRMALGYADYVVTEAGFGSDLGAEKYFNLVCASSLSDNAKLRGRPWNFAVTVTDLRSTCGAGFVVAYMGEMMTMPGLPKEPAALQIGLDQEERITGLF